MTMNERIVIHASRKKKFFVILGFIIFSLLTLFLLTATPTHPNPLSYFIYRSTGVIGLLIILAIPPRIWEILTKPVLVIDDAGVHLTRTSIPWSHIRAVRCEDDGQWIYVTVHPAEMYRRLNRVSKRWGFQREDEVFLNLAPAANEDYLATCRIIRQHLGESS